MSLILSPRVVAAVTAATSLCFGCRVATEYTPTSPGKVAIGMERGELGLYKNGGFARLSSGVPAVLGCSGPAAATATTAAAHHDSYRRNLMISAGVYAVAWLMPPIIGLGAYFGVRAEHERQQSFALAVDAVNQHNDTAACVAAPASAAATAGGQP